MIFISYYLSDNHILNEVVDSISKRMYLQIKHLFIIIFFKKIPIILVIDNKSYITILLSEEKTRK